VTAALAARVAMRRVMRMQAMAVRVALAAVALMAQMDLTLATPERLAAMAAMVAPAVVAATSMVWELTATAEPGVTPA
jgi:hypothetical protein